MEETINTLSYTPVYDQPTIDAIENEFSRLKGECYLDHAGATLYSDTQIKNVTANLQYSLYANPHSIGAASSATHDIIERMRYCILDHFHTSTDEYSVIFTSGATASLKIISESFLFNKNEASTASSTGYFVYTQDNHTSVLGMREVVAKQGAKVICLSHDTAFKVFNQCPQSLSLSTQEKSNSLFVYPAQCNFSGLKYPLAWIKSVKDGALNGVVNNMNTQWYILLDAAAFVSTNDLDLSVFKPDFVCLSFYKMFGYPTGIGALLVKNSSAHVLQKIYYGGGTVDVSLSSEMFHVKRNTLHQRFEDGTVPFLSIASLQYGFDILKSITMTKISRHVFSLASFLYRSLLTLHHSNGEPVVRLYSDTVYDDCNLQGGIVSFNLMRSNGEYIGYMEVLNMAALYKIHIRTGCFCNPGACQRHLSLSNKEVLQNYDAGYTCGGAADLINGKPTGAIRVSFGYMSTMRDILTLLRMIRECFVDGAHIEKFPHWWSNYKISMYERYKRYKEKVQPEETVLVNNDTISNKLQNIKETFAHIISNGLFSKPSLEIGNNTKKCVLEQLHIYPIKSCAAYEVTSSWTLNSKGLQYDREWMIMTSSGACLTQKQHTNLCLLKPTICTEKKTMTLDYPGMPPIEVPLEQTSTDFREATLCKSRVCGHKVEGIDCGTEVSEWLSLALGRPKLRLIRQTDPEDKKNATNKPELSFSSQSQYLAINKASISWLNDKISDPEFPKDTTLYRFRGNMILGGCTPFEEMQWTRVKIGKSNFTVNGPCTRCQMICIDQTTGIKTVEPLRTLAEEFHGKLKFGIYLTRETTKKEIINIGDVVYFT